MKRKNSVQILSALLLIATQIQAVGDGFSFVKSARDSKYFFVMDEAKTGACYKVKRLGDFQMIWNVTGWYSYPEELFLSSNGENLIRFLELTAGKDTKESGEKALIEIYVKGKLQKRYQVKELFDLSKHLVRYTSDPSLIYTKRPGDGTRMLYANEFIDKLPENEFREILKNYPHTQLFLFESSQDERFVFDLKSGEIISRQKIQNIKQADPFHE